MSAKQKKNTYTAAEVAALENKIQEQQAQIEELKRKLEHMKQHLLEQNVIHADETVVQVLKEDGKPATSESRMWVYSMVETAKANGLDPYDYLLYALSVLPYYGKSISHEMLESAMPWISEVQQRIGKEAQAESE